VLAHAAVAAAAVPAVAAAAALKSKAKTNGLVFSVREGEQVISCLPFHPWQTRPTPEQFLNRLTLVSGLLRAFPNTCKVSRGKMKTTLV